MPRKATEQFIHTVLNSISSEHKSILEIANSSKTTWESTKRALEFLESLGVIESKQEQNKKTYFRKDYVITTEYGNTWFNIPLDFTDENTINFIFENSKKIWKEKTGNELGKTQAQKVLVKVNTACDLKLPVGKYLYGMICVKPFDPNMLYQYQIPANNQQIISAITSTIGEYSKLSVSELKLQHYAETKNSLYLAKENSLTLACDKFTKVNFSNFCNSLSDILINLPRNELDLIQLFVEFLSISNNLLQLDEGDLISTKNDVNSTFNEVWKAIATKLFFNDLSAKYSRHQLTKLAMEVYIQMDIANEAISQLSEYAPKKSYTKCSEYEELKKLQGSVKEVKDLTEEESHRLAEESAKDSSKIFRKLGLD